MKNSAVQICRFDSAGDLRGKKRTYASVKARVLEVGRFSVFEATENTANARLFTQLCRDPELEIVKEPEFAFPWTGVRLKTKPTTTETQRETQRP